MSMYGSSASTLSVLSTLKSFIAGILISSLESVTNPVSPAFRLIFNVLSFVSLGRPMISNDS